ncbi:MAG: RNA 2',3'-cyclic phosphodiesterase [Elusimicrobiota bacterium]
MRLFIAIPISEDIRKGIEDIQDDLKKKLKKGKIRWVEPHKIHLTLNFLGNIESEKKDKIIQAMKKSVKEAKQFKIEIKNGGVFPSARRPRVLWIGCQDTENKVTDIKKKLDKELKVIGYKREKRKYTPHLTVGRIKYIRKNSKMIDFLLNQDINLGILKVNKIHLVESVLSPKGAQYSVVESVEF